MCTPLHGPVWFTIYSGVRLVGHVFPKIAPSPLGSSPPRNTMFLGPSPLIIPNGTSNGSSVFVRVPNAMLHNALSMGKKTLKTALSSWDFVTMPEEDLATAICNMHEKLGKDRACSSGDIIADRDTNTHTDMLITILCNHSRGQSNNSSVSLKQK